MHMRLSHLHLPNPIPYIHSLKLQEALLERHFAHKIALRNHANASTSPTTPSPPPPPTLLTFQTHPTYTVGRRHLTSNPLSAAQIAFLTGASSSSSSPSPNPVTKEADHEQLATFFPSPRGGLLTYHAPGQLTAYLILDLRRHGLTPRCYIRLLENVVIRTCARHGVGNTLTTEDPGVWIGEEDFVSRSGSGGCNDTPGQRGLRATNRKICAIGVHVSRGITSHGIGLNVYDAPVDTNAHTLASRHLYTLPRNNDNIYTSSTSISNAKSQPQESIIPAPGYLSWGFSRIVACGLEGKRVTWLSREQQEKSNSNVNLELESVAESLADEVARGLELEGEVERIGEEVVLGG